MTNLYKQSGVDIEKGYEAVERMKKHIARTNRAEVLGSLGNFGGLFQFFGLSFIDKRCCVLYNEYITECVFFLQQSTIFLQLFSKSEGEHESGYLYRGISPIAFYSI